MADINNFTITGRLVRDAEFKTLPSGKSLLEMSVAVNTGYGQYKKTTWVKVQQWGDRGANVAAYLIKGTLIGCTGELTTQQWEGKQDGQIHTDLVLSTMNVQILSSKKQESSEEYAPAPAPVDESVF